MVDEVGGFNTDFVGRLSLFEDQTFLEKVYLAVPVYFAPDVWLDYRLHDQSCVVTLVRDGLEEENWRFFLDWFDAYVADTSCAGRERVIAAVARARWELDHPAIGTVLRKARNLHRRMSMRLKGLSRPVSA